MIRTLTVKADDGVVEQVNVNVPLPCAEQYTPPLCQSDMDAGAGVTITSLDVVTPDTDLVQVVVADQSATAMVTVVDTLVMVSMLPLPKIDVLLMVLMFVPLTRAACLAFQFEISVDVIPAAAEALNTGSVSV